MVKCRRTTRVPSIQKSAEEEFQTPEQTQIMREPRRRTRSQTKTQSGSDHIYQPHSDSHFEQQSSSPPESHSHAQPQIYSYSQGPGDVKAQHEPPTGLELDASVELYRNPKHLGLTQGLRTPRTATISYEEFCDGVHNYVEAQHGAPTVSQQESPMDLEYTPQHLQDKCLPSSSRTIILGPSGESRRTRGFTKLSRIWNLPEGYKVGVQFNNNFQPIKHEGGLLKRFLGTCARKPHLVPINFKNWPKVPLSYKQGLWDVIKSKFEIPMAHEREIEKVLLQRVGLTWRGYKCHLKAQYFDENKSVEEIIANVPPRVDPEQWASLVALWNTSEMKTLSQANKAVRKHQKLLHTAGQRSFADIAEEMKEKDGVAPTKAELFILTHKRKDGTAINEESAKKIAEMEKLLAQRQENSRSSNEDIGWQNDADDGDGDGDGDGADDIDYQVMEESNNRMLGLRSASTPPRKSSRLSRTVANARKDYDMETMSGPEDSRPVGKDKMKIVEDRRRVQEVKEGTNCVRDFNTPSKNTSPFSPIAAIARMVSEDNRRQVGEDRTAACGDRRQDVEGRIRVEERRRDKNVREKARNTPSRNSPCLSPIVARATVVPEKDTRQVDEERLRAYEEGMKQVEEERKRVEEERKRVEEDRRKVEEDRRQVQEDRKQAEEDRKKSDSEIRFLKERLTWMENLVSRLLPVADSTTIPREVPHLRSDPNHRARMYSATSSHAQEHYSTDQ